MMNDEELASEVCGGFVDLCRAMLRGDHEGVEAALDAAEDVLINSSDESDHVMIDSILDGLRWGFRSCGIVESGGGIILRLHMPRGIRITNEWRERPSDETRQRIMQSVSEAILYEPRADQE